MIDMGNYGNIPELLDHIWVLLHWRAQVTAFTATNQW
jgi:hypothetical protein